MIYYQIFRKHVVAVCAITKVDFKKDGFFKADYLGRDKVVAHLRFHKKTFAYFICEFLAYFYL